MRYVVLHKPRGQTPLAALEIWKASHPEYAGVPACYAGRLDPMAEGRLLVLLGDECKQLKKYTELDKEYEVEVLLDVTTDTGDVLGLPSYKGACMAPTPEAIARALRAVTGTHRVPYPAFSSKAVDGKPLFLHALEGNIDTIRIPTHEETIHAIKLTGNSTWDRARMSAYVEDALRVVPRSDAPSKRIGDDFRQDTIRSAWQALIADMEERSFCVLKLRVTCGSGTYMRPLASRIGQELGTDAFAASIIRTKIGLYRSLGPLGFWTKAL